jgi:hypothetical protein
MSPIALTLNLALGALLIGAMILGQRLDKRLRALRESHNSFAKAVSELDAAAERTHVGLRDLKAAAEDTHLALAGKIEAAHALSDRLSKLVIAAEAKAEALSRISADVKTPRPILLRAAAEAPAPPKAQAAAPTQPIRDPLRTQPLPRPAPAVRTRPVADDELFEAVRPGLSALAGGRR